ncbi:MAG: zinc ribbon domain-containing protein [Fusobacteriaceae bacterium]
MQVQRFYPSSKRCSKCGEVKRNLKLSDRVFQCECGHEIDRDCNR